MSDVLPYPEVFNELAEAAGATAAWALVAARGGQVISVPRKVGRRHWLAMTVGFEAATKICSHFADKHQSRVLVPNMRHQRDGIAAVRAIEAGKSNNEAAAATGFHERTIRRYRARMRHHHQGDLFPVADDA
jgi:hypothetical protein